MQWEGAADAITRGFYVFPCPPRKKFSTTCSYLNAVGTVEEALAMWPGDNFNCAIAACVKPGYRRVCFDCDHGLADEFQFFAWCESNRVPPTYTVRTGRRDSFGVQLWFDVPENIADVKQSIWERDGASGETRTRGHGMAPGSIHPSGNEYELLVDGPVATLPLHMLEWFVKESHTGTADKSEKIKTGRHDAIKAVASRLFDSGLNQEANLAACLSFYNQRIEKAGLRPITEDEIRKIVGWFYQPGRESNFDPGVIMGSEQKEPVEKKKPTDWTQNLPGLSKVLSAPDPEWLIDRLFLRGGLNLICGAQGAQKTILSLFVAKIIANPLAADYRFLTRAVLPQTQRRKILSEKIEKGRNQDPDFFDLYVSELGGLPVIYVDRENPPSVAGNRLRKLGLLGSNDFHYLNADTPEPDDRFLLEWAQRTHGVVIFDSLSSWYGDQVESENDNIGMGNLLKAFQLLARAGATVIVLHHAKKQQRPKTLAEALENLDTAYRGCTSLVSTPDMSIGMVRNPENPEEIVLGEIRFRACEPWQLRARIDWKACDGTRVNLIPMGDLDGAGIIQDRTAVQSAKQAAKTAKDEHDLRKLEEVIQSNPQLRIRSLEDKTGIRRARASHLLDQAGWRFIDKQWRVCTPENGQTSTPENEQRSEQL